MNGYGPEKQLELAAAVAYDLRSQAAVVLAAKELLERNPAVTEDARMRQALQCIERSVYQMERASVNLWDVARAADGALKPAWEPVCLNDVCRELCAEARKYRAGVNVRQRLPRKPLVIQSDPYFLDRILLNLLRNAMEACPEGKITLNLKATANGAVIIVDDEGGGLPPERLMDPFSPRYYAAGANSQLGMHVSWLLAKGLGGALAAENLPQQGARFTLTLPAQQLHSETLRAVNAETARQVRLERVRLELGGMERCE